MNCLGYLTLIVGLVKCLQATHYEIIADDSAFIRPCKKSDGTGNFNIMDLMDISKLKYTMSDDMETVYTNGKLFIKKSLPDNVPIKLDIELMRWERGRWAETIYSIKRDDLCKSLFTPGEIWQGLLQAIPEEQRICPPKKGMSYTFTNRSNKIILPFMPTSDMAGRYKAVSHFRVGKYSSCAVAQMEIYKLAWDPVAGFINNLNEWANKTLEKFQTQPQ